MVIDKKQKTTVVTDEAIPAGRNIKKKEHEKTQKYQELKEQLEQMWKVKSKVVQVVAGTLRAVILKLEKWFQQISGTTSEVSI